ncbi:MAG: 2-oxoisovalerate dehydrogenase component alpha subunit, partial [Actinomycetota bacterium]|nr:2-oxoisovalerate dehydrogenase component alpha subunit [Actinomycetota bacterium]
IPGIQIDGNDVLISYAASRKYLEETRAGGGPRFIEAVTYRMGAHTSSDDPTKYRTDALTAQWGALDPIARFETYLRGRGASDAFFAELDEEAAEFADSIRRRTLELGSPATDLIFDNVYSEPHPLVDQQKEWLANYEASFAESEAAQGGDGQ